MINELIQFVEFLEPWQFGLVAIFMQIALLVGLAWLVYRRLNHLPREQHFVWLAALIAIGCALPLQFLMPGWTFQVERKIAETQTEYSNADISITEEISPLRTSVGETKLPVTRSAISIPDISESKPADIFENSNRKSSSAAEIRASRFDEVSHRSDTARELHVPSWKTILSSIYLVILGWMLLRLSRGWWLLKSIDGNQLGAECEAEQMIDRIAKKLKFKRAPRVLISPEVDTPMAYGIFRPVVLLPCEFLTWSRECQEVVLSHEFCHIRRRDAVWDLMSRLICAFYWFHPAVHFASHSLRKTRETATDLAVLKLGISPASYARQLLNVAVANKFTAAASVPALRMAGEQNFETRIRRILGSPLANEKSQSLGKSVAFHLVLLASFFFLIGTSLQMTIANVTLQEKVADAGESLFPEEVEDEQVSGADFYTTVAMTQVRKRPSNFRLVTVTGVIRDASHQPVSDAIVILRDGKSMSASANRRLNDVLGKARTNSDGEYSIEAGVSPGEYDVRFELAAISKTGQMGWIRINRDQSRADSISLDLSLAQMRPVKGRLVTESGDPVANAQVRLSGFRRHSGRQHLEYTAYEDRVIAPQVMTDEQGDFEFPALPSNHVCDFYVRHADYAEDFFCIRSSGDHRVGFFMFDGDEIPILKNGGTNVVRKGVRVSGTVLDANSDPKASVWVELVGQTMQTDANGKFEMLLDKRRLGKREDFEFHVFHSDNPRTRFSFPVAKPDLEEVVLRLTKPVLISGTLLAADDKSPVVGVRMLIISSNGVRMTAVTNDEGQYNLAVPTGKITVKVDGIAPGFKTLDRNRNTDDDKPGPLMREFDLEYVASKELKPFLLQRLDACESQIVDEFGDPVSGAQVQLYSGWHDVNSHIETTLQDGLVELTPLIAPEGNSTIVARYERDGQLFLGQALIDNIRKRTRVEILPATEARGRVTLNGNPLPGVTLRVTSSWIASEIVTDENGAYKISVPKRDAKGDVGEVYVNVASGVPNWQASGCSNMATLNDDGVYDQDIEFFNGPRTISGTVVDSNGDPVEGLFVNLESLRTAKEETYQSYRHYQPSRVYSNHEGKFTLQGLHEDVVFQLRTGFWGPSRDKRENFIDHGEQNIHVHADESEIWITLGLKK